jgi:Na+/H+ antiporter NhaD/arsenite permease-like protein
VPVFATLAAMLLALMAPVSRPADAKQSEAQFDDYVITGRLVDNQGQPIPSGTISAHTTPDGGLLGEAESREDGYWTLAIHEAPQGAITISVEKPHFEAAARSIPSQGVRQLAENRIYRLGVLQLERRVGAGFWMATAIFITVLALIAFERMHSTTAALAGLSAIFVSTFVLGNLNADFHIFDFERALTFINWEVIFLVMGMMIIVAIIEETGIFKWTAFQAYRLSGGRSWLLVLILIAITAVASALLDNFTTMLLMTPISLQIGLALGINPLALIIPEVMASNVGGISTLIGTPTNILIGAYADIGFSGFLLNQTIGVLLALLLLSLFVLFYFRAEWAKQSPGLSPKLYQALRDNARIEEPGALWKSGLVFFLVLVGFVIGERFHVPPAVPALLGATALLVWLKPDVHHMIQAVDWTTLVFFIALFIVVGAVQEVGLISLIADGISGLVGESLILAIFVIVFGVGTLSVAIANIPLAASMLPVIEFLSGSIPGGSSKVLYYALSMGAAMGGNGMLVGAEANLVTAGITEQAGMPISFTEFLKIGLPVTYLTLSAGFLWLLLRFVLL